MHCGRRFCKTLNNLLVVCYTRTPQIPAVLTLTVINDVGYKIGNVGFHATSCTFCVRQERLCDRSRGVFCRLSSLSFRVYETLSVVFDGSDFIGSIVSALAYSGIWPKHEKTSIHVIFHFRLRVWCVSEDVSAVCGNELLYRFSMSLHLHVAPHKQARIIWHGWDEKRQQDDPMPFDSMYAFWSLWLSWSWRKPSSKEHVTWLLVGKGRLLCLQRTGLWKSWISFRITNIPILNSDRWNYRLTFNTATPSSQIVWAMLWAVSHRDQFELNTKTTASWMHTENVKKPVCHGRMGTNRKGIANYIQSTRTRIHTEARMPDHKSS